METNYKELIKKSNSFRKKEYIDYFFKNIVGTNEAPIYCKEGDPSKDCFDIAIVKNYKEELSKIGNPYVGNYWRTCIFYCIDRTDAIKYLSTNGKEGYSFVDGIISWERSDGFDNKKIDKKAARTVNVNLLKHFKKARSSWFVRSYVYFVLIICDDNTPISVNDFYIDYYDRKYKFKAGNKASLFGRSKKITFVENVLDELKLIRDENKDSIDCVKAYFGDLNFFPENEEAFTDVKKDMEDGIPYIFCQGAARTGKTVLAFRLLREYPSFKLLLMNYNFYVSLRDAFAVIGKTFPYDRIFHHDLKHRGNGCWVSGLETKTIRIDITHLIVDEAQRLGAIGEAYTRYGKHLSSFDSIDCIVNCKNHVQTVFFGDDSQMLNPKYDKGFAAIKKAIDEKDYREYYFSSPLGIPQEVLKNVKFLLNYDNSTPSALNDFSIDIEKDPESFANRYINDAQRKKHLVASLIGDVDVNSIKIGDKLFKSLKTTSTSKYLFNATIQNEYFLTAYSVISREIESVYLYIPGHIYLDDDGTIKSKYSQDNSFLMKHLYTIMTRSTMSLVICCEDEKLGNYFNERIEAIKAEVEQDQEDELPAFDYDLFIAYFGTDRPEGTYQKAKEICDVLKEKGLQVFLYNYSYIKKDANLKFTETWHALHRSETMLFVFNENVDKDQAGLILRELSDGSVSQIYQELSEFHNLVDLGLRKAKYDARFFYSGTRLKKFNIYPFLNRYFPPLTQGNSNCCFLNLDDLLEWINTRFFLRLNNDE